MTVDNIHCIMVSRCNLFFNFWYIWKWKRMVCSNYTVKFRLFSLSEPSSSQTLMTLCCELSMAERKHGYFPRTIIGTSLGIPKGFLWCFLNRSWFILQEGFFTADQRFGVSQPLICQTAIFPPTSDDRRLAFAGLTRKEDGFEIVRGAFWDRWQYFIRYFFTPKNNWKEKLWNWSNSLWNNV